MCWGQGPSVSMENADAKNKGRLLARFALLFMTAKESFVQGQISNVLMANACA